MTLDLTADFLDAALRDPTEQWTADGLRTLAQCAPPDNLLGQNLNLLRADVYRLWARWFSEAVSDPSQFAGKPDYGRVYSQTRRVVKELWGNTPEDERNRFAARLARLTMQEIQRLEVERQKFSPAVKAAVLAGAGTHPRCWICGYGFEPWALQKFKGEAFSFPGVKLLVDRFKPRLVLRHYQIEIDHIVPVAAGGTNLDNLKIACGWCNLAKRDMVSVYEIRSHPKQPDGAVGRLATPRPIWVVRLLATRSRCEHPDGCPRDTTNAELTLAPKHQSGATNPINLRVTCREHDTIQAQRLLSPTKFPAYKS